MSRAQAAALAVFACIMVVIFYGAGWYIAHSNVALECQRLGAFYVGNKTYTCQVKL